MPVQAEMKDQYLKKLRCAYTGKPVKVMMSGTEASLQLYFVEDAFDPGAWFKTSEAIMEALGTRDGIVGAARHGAEFVCPYTGVRMAIEKRAGFGFRAVGGYRPCVPVGDPFLLARKMMTRNGVVPADAPKPAMIVANILEDKTPEETNKPVVTDDEALAAAEKIVKEDLPVPTTITVIKPSEG